LRLVVRLTISATIVAKDDGRMALALAANYGAQSGGHDVKDNDERTLLYLNAWQRTSWTSGRDASRAKTDDISPAEPL
jgi:hypothetical protein